MTQFYTPAPCTPEQRAEIEQHWANVRAGLRSDQPEPEYKTPREVVEMHKYLAMDYINAAARHARQAMEVAQ